MSFGRSFGTRPRVGWRTFPAGSGVRACMLIVVGVPEKVREGWIGYVLVWSGSQ